MLSRKLLLASLFVAGSTTAFAQTARIQVIHNCADAAANQVDVYLNNNLLLDDFEFRTATPFVDIPAGSPITLSVAPGNSTSVSQAIYNLNTTLMSGGTYIAVANGIVSATGYTPSTPFRLDVYAMGREAATNAGNTDVLVMHGSTDAPTVDVRSGINTLVDDASFGDFAGYLELPTADYKIRVTTETGSNTVQTYSAPLSTLSLSGEALVVVASGFLNPAVNSNGPAFGLYAATAAGGALLALPTTDPEALARLQVIHNSADAMADMVDVYVGSDLLLDNFAFRTATPFIDVPADVAVSISVAPKTSTSVADAVYNVSPTFDSAGTYIAVANGIVSPMGYMPAQPFALNVYNMAREAAAMAGNTDILVAHGATDAPVVDVRSGTNVLVNDIAYSNFSMGYVSLPVNNYTITLTDATGNTEIQKYQAPLQGLGLGGQAITVVASGFVNPAANSNGAGFGLYVATAAGGALVQLPVATNVAMVNGADATVDIYPNPAANALYINGDLAKDKAVVTITDVSGRVVYSDKYTPGAAIDISALNAGMYLVKVAAEGKTAHQKLVKQ